MHFASGRTKFAETWKPQKRQLQTCWRYSATNVAIYYIINEINKNRSKLKPCSAKVGREKTRTPKNERKEIEGRSKGREGGKNLDNPSLVREGTAKSASHEDCNPLTRPIPTPPLSMIGSFFWLNASIDPRRSKSTT